jgi:tetratricopeptide (TPR) repeat protein
MVGKTYYLTLSLISVKTGELENVEEDKCKCEVDELLDSTKRLAKKLLGEMVESTAQDINITRQSVMTRKDSQNQSYLALAQQAFNENIFTEPQGENTIEYLRRILIDDPENTAALDLEKRSVAAYENEAEFARARKNETRALEIYQRLFSLYPEKKEYLDEFVKLEALKFPDISGNWYPNHVSGEIYIYNDGRCIIKDFLSFQSEVNGIVPIPANAYFQ